MSPAARSYPVPPDSVYVWRGFKPAAASYDSFAAFLGSVFVPACALLQPRVGLRAYLPCMVPQANKSSAVPDQTALMFWATPQSHDLAAKAIAVRIYQNLHGDAYDMTRSSTGAEEKPVPLPSTSGALKAEQPYYLLDGSADWMIGQVQHFVGARAAKVSAVDFLTGAFQWASAFRAKPVDGIDGALLCCGSDYVAAWVHTSMGASLADTFSGFSAFATSVLDVAAVPTTLDAGLWEDWAGLNLTAPGCLNLQFERPIDARPRKRVGKIHAIHHFENPHLALWKSCVSEVLARHLGLVDEPGSGIDADHPLMRATDRYCEAMNTNAPLPEPSKDSDDEEQVQTWLSYLHHKRAHAHIAENTELEAQLVAQTAQFKYGNPLWQDMYVQYFKYYWDYPFHLGRKPHYRSWQASEYGKDDLHFGVIDWRLPHNARVAIVGDIGTGTDLAASVLVAAMSFKPDAILHLGDIYFSGTRFETEHRMLGLLDDVFRSERRRVPFFTVPGNHEYFTGAISYFRMLDSGRLAVEPAQGQHASYFCLRTSDNGWQFLGMDTGYNGHYMNVAGAAQKATLDRLHTGKIETSSDTSDPNWPSAFNPYFQRAPRADIVPKDTTSSVDQVLLRSDELLWHHDKMKNFAGRTILLSHHQLYSALDVCGVAPGQTAAGFDRTWIDTALWRQLGPAFGDKVALWIWGHEHNLGIFQDDYRPADWPVGTPDARDIFKTLPKGRCAGHGAIPVQEQEAPYEQKYPVRLVNPNARLGLNDGWYNRGFELVEFQGVGKPARVSYFEISGADPTPLPIYVEVVG